MHPHSTVVPAWPDLAQSRFGPAEEPESPVAAADRKRGRIHASTDKPTQWLSISMLALGVLAAAAAVVSYAAQYRMVFAAKASASAAALEAGIPDVAALIFATLGIALALHGKRAIRARVLNLGAVATSVAMNVLAAGHGWRDLAIWVMPPVAYALASDTAIGVVRAWTIARQKALNEALADDEHHAAGDRRRACCCGCCGWRLRRFRPCRVSAAGFSRSAPSRQGAAAAALPRRLRRRDGDRHRRSAARRP